jgi:membrane-bound lytic murein transglycosylase D
MLDVGFCAKRTGRAVRSAVVASAVLISGCFNAGPSVKQAMTSGAPVVAPAVVSSAPAPVTTGPVAPATSFNLDKPEVHTTVATFQTRLRGFFDGALLRGAKYLPTMTDMLIREGLPAELAYLPLIESGYQPDAVSHAGAVGPWQFIPETGKRYGLRIDSMVDERRDPIKSTQAAAQYLKELHEMFGDWELSLAAYNSGEYRVARIIADTGADDFWDMRKRGYLPSETSQYVPRFLAAVRIAKAPHEYGFAAREGLPFQFETVHVDRQVSLHAAAGMCGVSTAELTELNPALRRGISPSGYALRVPTGAAEPLRAALANYVEPARPARRVARAARRQSARTEMARAERRRETAKGLVAAPARTANRRPSPAKQKPALRTAVEQPRRQKSPSRARLAGAATTAPPKPAKSPFKRRPS